MADYTVQEISDPGILAAQQAMATAQTTVANTSAANSAANTSIATAQTSMASAQTAMAGAATQNLAYNANIAQAQGNIAMSATRVATALEEYDAEAAKPHRDHVVWLAAASARAVHPDRVVSSWPEVAVFADKIVAAYKQRYPRV